MKIRDPKVLAKRPVREVRQAMLRVCQMSTQNLPDQRVIILNISARGMGCRAVHPPGLGASATFLLGPFGEADGHVCWVNQGRFGIRFVEEVDSLAIRFTKEGFRSRDYDLPRSEAFENFLLSELFRSGELR
jgi:hypothetical protein